jgi:hypothetical protein
MHLSFSYVFSWLDITLLCSTQVIFHFLDVPHFIYPFSYYRTFLLLPYWAMMNTSAETSIGGCVDIVSIHTPRSVMAGLYDKKMFSNFGNCQTIF